MKLTSILNTFTETISKLDKLVETNNAKAEKVAQKVDKFLEKGTALSDEAISAAKVAAKLKDLLS